MRRTLMSLVAAMAIIAATASVATASGGAAVTGTVVVGASGAPVAGACIRLLTSSTRSPLGAARQSSSTGEFQFGGLVPGSYVLATCLPPTSPYAQASMRVSASPTTSSAPVRLTLELGGSLSGTLVSSAGGPARGLEVLASPRGGAAQPGEMFTPPRSLANGRYTVTNLAPGVYVAGIGDETGPGDRWGYTSAQSAPVRVVAGATTAVPPLRVTADGAITGVAVDFSTGRPLAHTCLQAKGPGMSYPATPSATGRFTFTALVPGRWVIATCFATAGVARHVSEPIVVRTGALTSAGSLRLS